MISETFCLSSGMLQPMLPILSIPISDRTDMHPGLASSKIFCGRTKFILPSHPAQVQLGKEVIEPVGAITLRRFTPTSAGVQSNARSKTASCKPWTSLPPYRCSSSLPMPWNAFKISEEYDRLVHGLPEAVLD